VTWTKLGDEFPDECWELSDAAYRLHTEGLCWSNLKGTDGRLLKSEMRRWAKRPEAAAELVNVGWWEDHGEAFQLVHHLAAQRTAASIRNQSNANSRNGKRGGRPRKNAAQKSESLSESLSESSNEMDRTGQDRNYATKEQKERAQTNGEATASRTHQTGGLA